MPRKKPTSRPVPPLSSSAFEQAWSSVREPNASPPTVSGRWLLKAASVALLAAAACAWLLLCLVFWQGNWQLLYHPSSAVTRTPASVGMAFDAVGFAASETGEARLTGWWIAAAPSARFTVLYLHGQTGNLSDTVDELAALHQVGVNVLAFDYRGYGQSQFAHPSEARWREDAESALQYLTATRHVDAGAIVLCGKDLGANLALEVAAAHPDLAGVIARDPLDNPVNAIFGDARAHLVPAHLLADDRYNADAAALRIPSLWLIAERAAGKAGSQQPQGYEHKQEDYERVGAAKMLVWLAPGSDARAQLASAVSRWLDDLPAKTGKP